MSTGTSRALAVVLVLAVVAAGCITDDDDDGNGGKEPRVGTTQGFVLPDFQFKDGEGVVRSMDSWGGDFTIVQVVKDPTDVFLPQFAQVRAVIERLSNVTVRALTLATDEDVTMPDMEVLASSVPFAWERGLPITDLVDRLSLIRPLTVFLLDADHVILLRSDEPLGEARMVQAIEATWGIEPPEDTEPVVGQALPETVWRDIDGKEGSLSSWRGSPVLLNVWELECPFCLQLFEQLVKVNASWSDQGLRMVSIDLVTWESEVEVAGVRDAHNVTWPIAMDGDDVQSRYDIWRLPLLVLLDGQGEVAWTWTGYVDHSLIDQQVEKLI